MKYYFSIIIPLLLFACATPIAPPGGSRDESPPKVVLQMPQSGMANYRGDRIEIIFDEYIVFSGGEDKIIITPAMPEKPKYIVKGKKLIIKLPKNLENDITYSISLMDAVSDYTEGNKTPLIRQVFATGEKVDSASLRGSVVNAFDLSPASGVFVGLYLAEALKDLQTKPLYITRTNGQGQFRMDYVKEGAYFIAALEDKNFNYVFDQITERVSLPSSLIELKGNMTLGEEIVLFENEAIVKVNDYKLLNNNKLYFSFSSQVGDLALDVKEYQVSDKAYFNTTSDTLFYHWTSDTLSSLTFYFTLNQVAKDTVIVPLGKNTLDDKLSVAENIPVNKPLIVNTSKYIEEFQMDGLSLKDSLNKDLKFSVTKDKEKLLFLLPEDAGGNITLKVDSGSITYFDGTFNTKFFAKLLSVGSSITPTKLILSFSEVKNGNIYLQVLNKEKRLLSTHALNGTNTLTLKDLNSGTYYIRVYDDVNNNGKWTTGSLQEMLKPEATLLFSNPIELKDNWDKEITLSF
jgi:hypothetical protein